MPKPSKQLPKDRDASERATSQLVDTGIGASASANSEGTSFLMTEALLKSISAAVAEEGKRILRSVNESLGKLETKVDNMMKSIDDVAATTTALVARQAEAETRISQLEDDIAPIKDRVDALEKVNKELKDKVSELECRQRRKNIRLLNLKESIEGNDPLAFFEVFIPKLLQLPVQAISIDRVHRGLRVPEEDRPRAVIIKLQHSRDVVKIMTAVKRFGNIQYEGRLLRIVPDVPPEVRAARRAFNMVCAELIRRNIRFRMAYPAILSFKVNETQKSFKDPIKAKTFLSTLT